MSSFNRFGHKALTVLLTCVTLLLGAVAYAQGDPSGKVVDSNGEPIIGASVIVKGTVIGVMTDIDGKFTIKAQNGATLEVSCIGYVTKTVAAAPGLTVVLEDDTKMLEETVVLGYGSV